MTGILNLTKDAVTLIAESGAKTTIPESGYVARVEYDEREVGYHSWLCDKDYPCHRVSLVEQTPREIVFHNMRGFEGGLVGNWTRENPNGLLLVKREVAEAAANKHECREGSDSFGVPFCDWASQPGGRCSKKGKPHPLASRMVWADNPVRLETTDIIIGYRELHRVGYPR